MSFVDQDMKLAELRCR